MIAVTLMVTLSTVSSTAMKPCPLLRSILLQPHHVPLVPQAQRNSFLHRTARPRFVSSISLLRHQPHDYSGLQSLLPHLSFNKNPYDLRRHGHGESYHTPAPPDIIVTPQSTDDIVIVLNYAMQHSIPVVPFGAGTSLEGHVHCIHGGISLDMAAFTSIEYALHRNDRSDNDNSTHYDAMPLNHPTDAMVTVGAGLTRMALNHSLRHAGYEFKVDPGADASLGGMVSTRASGTTTVMYGNMRENLVALECVLPLKDGAVVVSCGRPTLKNSAGYDLVSLLCGAEGTLGVVTKATLKLHPIVEHVVAAVCQFESLEHAARVVPVLMQSQVSLVRFELLDVSAVQAFNSLVQSGGSRGQPLLCRPTLLLEVQGFSETSLLEQIHVVQELCQEHHGSSFEFATTPEERKRLWSARHVLYYASIAWRTSATAADNGNQDQNERNLAKQAMGQSPRASVTDACVPLSQLAPILTATAEDVRQHEVVGTLFGHAGDGNFHVILPILDSDSEDYRARLHSITERLIHRTLAVGGTCSGEHGIGYGKIKFLEQQVGQNGMAVMKAIKQSLDPLNIMNPGKIVVG